MTLVSFRTKLETRIQEINSLLCVGLDPHEKELFPLLASGAKAISYTHEQKCDAAFTFCHTLIMATIPYTVCYKPNIAFFEALGSGGMEVLYRLIHSSIPTNIPILLDVKRGDIGSTAEAYVSACYDYLGVDAVTLSPLMGWDTICPFITNSYSNKGAFLLCKTSNPGSNDFLTLTVQNETTSSSSVPMKELLYERIARMVGTEWKMKLAVVDTSNPEKNNNNTDTALLGLVVGATDPIALQKARQVAGDDVWILAPGIGIQGGELMTTLQAGLNKNGTGLLIPLSRAISQSTNPSETAKQICTDIQQIREQIMMTRKATTTTDEQDKEKQKLHNPDISMSNTTTNSHSIQQYQRDFLEFSLQQGVLKFGSFVLKSGRTSPYFFNAGLFASGAALYKLGIAYASTIMSSNLADGPKQVKFDVIFGPAYKGIPLGAVVTSSLYSDYGIDIGFAYNRKEAKDHGEGGQLVGVSMEGKRVLIVDDVITAGTAIRESCDLLVSVGATPIGVVTALDRAEIRSSEDRISAVQAVQRDLSMEVLSIVNLPQLQTFLEMHPYFDDTIRESVANYRKEYGV